MMFVRLIVYLSVCMAFTLSSEGPIKSSLTPVQKKAVDVTTAVQHEPRAEALEEPLDQTLAIIYHTEGNEAVLASDRDGALDGKPKTFREAVIERLMYLDARRYKITVSEDTLDRFVAHLLKNNNWSRFELTEFLERKGYSMEDGRELLRRQQMINQLLDHKIRSDPRMVVERSEAQKIYEMQPIVQEGSYTLEMTYIPFTKYKASVIDSFLKKNALPETVVWDEPFTLRTSEVEEERTKSLHGKSAGDIVSIDTHDDGYELTRLVSMTPDIIIPFDTCYAEIVGRVRQERFSEVLESYQNELLKNAHIKYCTEEKITPSKSVDPQDSKRTIVDTR